MNNECHCGDVIDFLLFLTIALAVGSALYAIVSNWLYSPKKNKNGGQIPPVKNPLPPPPELKNAMPRADAPPAPERINPYLLTDSEIIIVPIYGVNNNSFVSDWQPVNDDPPTSYPSDSGSTNSDSSPTDFSGGDFGGGGAGGEY